MNKFLIIILIISVSGCATAINEKNAHSYASAGMAAQNAGDWKSATEYWFRALTNAKLAGMPEKSLAIAFYEYGRSAGATCKFQHSEEALSKAMELDEKINGPVYMSIVELARLNLKQKNYVKAADYYSKLPPIYQSLSAEEKDPAGVALVYKEYSETLHFIGKDEEAEKLKNKSIALIKTSTEPSPAEVTPYGEFCS